MLVGRSAALLSVLAAGCGQVNIDGGGSATDAAPTAVDAAPVGAGADASSPVVELIDDFEDGDDRVEPIAGRVGFWYVVNDGTGTQEPFPDFTPEVGGAGDSDFAGVTRGSGFVDWGAKLGVRLNHPDRGANPLPYDLGGYTGIQLRARGDVAVRIVLVTVGTMDADHGGACVQAPDDLCDDYHGLALALDDEWRELRVPFADLEQVGWGQEVALDLTGTVGIELEMEDVPSFDIAIDDVALY